MKKIFTFSIFTMWLLSCSQSNNNTKDKGISVLKDERIRSELVAMMKKEGPYTFLIFEEPTSGKFVQFAGNKNEELLFDLPSGQLNKGQFQKASEILKRYDIKHETSPTYTDETETVENGTLSAFSKRINNDIDLAVELTSRIMIDVFGFKDNVKLEIKTD